MNKKEVAEIRKTFDLKHCTINKIAGCYVSQTESGPEKTIEFQKSFLNLPEEDAFKYFDIFKKGTAGVFGKTLKNISFSLEDEDNEGPQIILERIRDSKLQNTELLSSFYDSILDRYPITENYLVLLYYSEYDVPIKTKDRLYNDDSEEVYSSIGIYVCPVKLAKAGLACFANENDIKDSSRMWMVNPPVFSVTYPAFDDRSANIHGALVYAKKVCESTECLSEIFTGHSLENSITEEKEMFSNIISSTLGDDCSIENAQQILDAVSELVTEHENDDVPFKIEKNDIERIVSNFIDSNTFSEKWDTIVGREKAFSPAAIIPGKMIEINIDDYAITKVSLDVTESIKTELINGVSHLCIPIQNKVTFDQISIRH